MGIQPNSNASVSTSVDRLLEALKDNPEMTFPNAAKELGVSEKVLESWVQFLEETGDVVINYKFTTPYISLSKKRQSRMQSNENEELLKRSMEDLIAHIDSEMDKASKMIKSKKAKEASSFMSSLASKAVLFIDALKDKNVPLQEVDVFRRELQKVDAALKEAEEMASKKNNRNALKNLNIAYQSLLQTQSNAKSTLSRYREKEAVKEQPKDMPAKEEAAVRQQKALYSHDELTKKIKEHLKKGEIEEANKLYAELDRLYKEELPKRFEEERENLKKSLFHISKDLTFARDSEQNSRYIKARGQIMDGFSSLAKIITDGRVADAIYTLRYIQGLFSNLPEGYEEEKKEMQARLAQATKQIADLRSETIKRVISNYDSASQELHKEFYAGLEQRDLKRSQRAYNSLKMAFQRFPSELVPEKTEAHLQLLSDFQDLSKLFKEVFVEQNKSRITNTRKEIESLNVQIAEKAVESAQKTYNRIQIMLQEISDYYFADKAALQNELIDSYKNLSDISSVHYKDEFMRVSTQLMALISEGERYVDRKEYELAEQSYVKALDLYNTLKPGFMDKRKEIRSMLFEFYRKIIYMKDMGLIERNSKTVQEAYSQIISLIIDAHHNIALNDIQSLPGIVSRIDSISPKIPLEIWQKSPSVEREIRKLKEEEQLFKLLKEYEVSTRGGNANEQIKDRIKESIISVARNSPEDTNLIDYAKSILMSSTTAVSDSTVVNKQSSVERQLPPSIGSDQYEKETVDIKEGKGPLKEYGKTRDKNSKEDKEDNDNDSEFEKTVSAALMLSAMEDPMKDEDLPDLRESIETRKTTDNNNHKDKHKTKVKTSIMKLKEMLGSK
ncbi:MAG: hypothetical protein ACMXYL_01300 [Candidatus Woesearchaeota archaeon]